MQTIATLLLVTLAAGYVGRAGVRTVRSALGVGPATTCGSGCGKCAAVPEAPSRRIALTQI